MEGLITPGPWCPLSPGPTMTLFLSSLASVVLFPPEQSCEDVSLEVPGASVIEGNYTNAQK